MLELYENYYKLSADPFRLSPDHRFAFAHPSYAKSRAYLKYALHRGEGFVTITGVPGTGKTTLIDEILSELDRTRIQVAKLSSTQLEARELLHMVAGLFGLPLAETDKATLLLELERFLTEQSQKGRRAVLIVDEAQDLPPKAVEELRLLANLQHNHRPLLQVCLVGQEQLRELMAQPEMEHLRQRIVAASHLEPLDLDETVSYVEHRLSRAGWSGDPEIDAQALRLIHRFSGGIPRRINLICSRLFLYGAIEGKHALAGEDARVVITDLQQELLLSPGDAELHEDTSLRGLVAARSVVGLPRQESVVPVGASRRHLSEQAVEKPPTAVVRESGSMAVKTVAIEDQLQENSAPSLRESDGHFGSAPLAVTDEADAPPVFQLADSEMPEAGPALPELEPASAPTTGGSLRLVSVVAVVAALILALVLTVDYQARTTGMEVAGKGEIQREPSQAEQPRDQMLIADAGSVAAPPVVDASTNVSEFNAVELSGNATQAVTRATDPDKAAPEPQTVKSGTAGERGEAQWQDAIEQEYARLRLEAEKRAVDRESVRSSGQAGSTDEQTTAPPPSATKAAVQPPETGQIELQKNAPLVLAKAEAPKPESAPTVVAEEPQEESEVADLTLAEVISALLEGRWNKQGEPAQLLPSEITYCNGERTRIRCWTVPQTVSTDNGPVLSKVEATLQEFAIGGIFQLLYRTSVQPLAAESATNETGGEETAGDTAWQVTEHELSCELSRLDKVRCQDDMGVTRDYQRSSLATQGLGHGTANAMN